VNHPVACLVGALEAVENALHFVLGSIIEGAMQLDHLPAFGDHLAERHVVNQESAESIIQQRAQEHPQSQLRGRSFLDEVAERRSAVVYVSSSSTD